MSQQIAKTTRILRTLFLIIWALTVLGAVTWYLSDPSRFTAQNIAAFLAEFSSLIWLIYLFLSIVRGITLLPSTPLVLAGTILFPDQPFAVLAVSMSGILFSSTMIYYFSDCLGFSEYFESHKPALAHKIKAKLEHPLGTVIVAAWAFFPFVPTDLVCYLAGTTRMRFWKFIGAIFVGELILCVCYIFFGGSLFKIVR